MPEAIFQKPDGAADPKQIRALRQAALQRAADEGVHTLSADEGRWTGEQARIAAETGTHDVPNISARRAEGQGGNPLNAVLEVPGDAPEAAIHAAHVAVEQAGAGQQVVPVNVDPSGNMH